MFAVAVHDTAAASWLLLFTTSWQAAQLVKISKPPATECYCNICVDCRALTQVQQHQHHPPPSTSAKQGTLRATHLVLACLQHPWLADAAQTAAAAAMQLV